MASSPNGGVYGIPDVLTTVALARPLGISSAFLHAQDASDSSGTYLDLNLLTEIIAWQFI